MSTTQPFLSLFSSFVTVGVVGSPPRKCHKAQCHLVGRMECTGDGCPPPPLSSSDKNSPVKAAVAVAKEEGVEKNSPISPESTTTTNKIAAAGEANDPLSWRHSIRGFLLDITGVLYNSAPNGGCAIEGSVEAVHKLYFLRESGSIQLRFLSNESSSTRAALLKKLQRLGFTLRDEDFVTPAPVAAHYVRERQLRPHLLVHRGVESDFAECDRSNPNCVVMGDAEEDFTYENLNAAFRVLLDSEERLLISLGCNRFYQRVDGPCLDVGGFAMGLKYATGCRHVVIGKPEHDYFMSAVNDMGLRKEEVVMIGDDIVSDVGGAQKVGIRAVQVRTGKWRSEWENHPEVQPDLIANDLSAAIRTILER